MPPARSIAEAYHRLTNYTAENVRRGPTLDWAQQPPPFKEIVSQRRFPLRAHLPFPRDPFTGEPIEAPPPPLGPPPGLAELSRLLYFANGITGAVRFEGGGGQALRAAPSAGALYPTEIYVAVRDLPELEPGIYAYLAREHELVALWDGDFTPDIRRACGEPAAFADCAVFFLLTGVFWRSAWRYQERGYRRVLLDTGHVLGNLVAYAPAERCCVVPAAAFADSALNGLLFLDVQTEAALLCAALLPEVAASIPEPLLASRPTRAGRLKAVAIASPEDIARSATFALHKGSSCEGCEKRSEGGGAREAIPRKTIPLERDAELDAAIPQAILKRRSARAYNGDPCSLALLGAVLGYALGRGDEFGEGGPVRFATREAGLLDARLLAFRIEGLEPGLYEIEGAGSCLARLAAGALQEQFFEISLGQEIARTCAAAIALCAPGMESVARYGDRAYRYLHIDAGHVGERLQVAAAARNAGACGIGGFLDATSARLLQLPAEDWTLYWLTLGAV
ncbi:MAG: SagB family peptide dehydrogenase [Planctomycetaceae bacterium]